MRRFWILLTTELKAWRHDPITALGGFIAPGVMLIAFGLLFGGRLTFKLALVNYDTGPYGALLRQTFDETLSPFGTPYYDVADLPEDAAWRAYRTFQIDGVWVIPADFSARLGAGEAPTVAMHFMNYIDDRAKNHRIYAAEIVWRFYEKIRAEPGRRIELPGPPLALAEIYPLPELIHWFPIIAVGIVLLSITLGAMMNIFMLTYKEQVARITLEFGLAPRSLVWVLVPKALLALIMGWLTGVIVMGLVYLWIGIWPGRYLWAAWLLAGLVALFWIALALLLGLRTRSYMPGAIATILTGVLIFFISGGLSLVRVTADRVIWLAWLFPNTYAVDPIRDLVLFHAWPADWTITLLRLVAFAGLGLAAGMGLATRGLRRCG